MRAQLPHKWWKDIEWREEASNHARFREKLNGTLDEEVVEEIEAILATFSAV